MLNSNIIPYDTTLESARIRFSILRKMSIVERANIAIELSDNLRAIIESGVRIRHPDYDDNMVKLAAFRIAIGEQLFHQCYPDIEVKI